MLFELWLCNFFPNCTLIHVIMYSLIVMTCLHYAKRSLPYDLKVDQLQISNEPVQFQNNCMISVYGFCTVVGISHAIIISTLQYEIMLPPLAKLKTNKICGPSLNKM